MISGKKNNILKILFSFIVGMILVYYAIKDFNFNKFNVVIINADYTLICISSILLIFTVYLRAHRWKILLNNNCSLNFMYKAQLVGYFGNNILPLRLGEVLKTIFVGEKYNLSKSEIFGSVVLERVLDMFATGIIIAIVCFLNMSFFMSINSGLYYGFLIICFIGIMGLLLSYKQIKFLKKSNSRALSIIKDIYKGFTSLNKGNIVNVLLYTALIWFIYIIQLDLMQRAFSLNLSIYQSMILLAISTAAISIPALPGNFGTFEGAVVYSLSLFNIVDDFGFSFILHLTSFIPFTILGMIYLFQNIKLFKNKNIFKIDE